MTRVDRRGGGNVHLSPENFCLCAKLAGTKAFEIGTTGHTPKNLNRFGCTLVHLVMI